MREREQKGLMEPEEVSVSARWAPHFEFLTAGIAPDGTLSVFIASRFATVRVPEHPGPASRARLPI